MSRSVVPTADGKANLTQGMDLNTIGQLEVQKRASPGDLQATRNLIDVVTSSLVLEHVQFNEATKSLEVTDASGNKVNPQSGSWTSEAVLDFLASNLEKIQATERPKAEAAIKANTMPDTILDRMAEAFKIRGATAKEVDALKNNYSEKFSEYLLQDLPATIEPLETQKPGTIRDYKVSTEASSFDNFDTNLDPKVELEKLDSQITDKTAELKADKDLVDRLKSDPSREQERQKAEEKLKEATDKLAELEKLREEKRIERDRAVEKVK